MAVGESRPLVLFAGHWGAGGVLGQDLSFFSLSVPLLPSVTLDGPLPDSVTHPG